MARAKKTSPGRPTKLDDALGEKICESVKAGIGVARAAELAGVARRTVFHWLAKGRRDDQAGRANVYTRFLHKYEESSASAIAICEGTVLHAAVHKRDWRAAVTYLERRVPNEWGRKDTVNIAIDGALQELLDSVQPLMPPDHFRSFLLALAEVRGIKPPEEVIEVSALPA